MAEGGDALVSTHDPDGRAVELSAERWSHILDGHPELAPHLESVARAVREPDKRMAGRQVDED